MAAGARATVERAKGIDSDVLRAIAEEILTSLAEHGEAKAPDGPTAGASKSQPEPIGSDNGDEQSRGVAA